MMKKVITKTCVNMLIIPLSDQNATSLENFLHQEIVIKRDRNEFVGVINIKEPVKTCLISYGICDEMRFDEQERLKVHTSMVNFGQKWMKENGLMKSPKENLH